MDRPIENYWQIRLKDVKESLEKNHFEVFLAQDTSHARKIVIKQDLGL